MFMAKSKALVKDGLCPSGETTIPSGPVNPHLAREVVDDDVAARSIRD